jgi:tape measure domain-containing protein
VSKLTIFVGASVKKAESVLNGFRGKMQNWAARVSSAAKGAFVGIAAGLVAGLAFAVKKSAELAASFEQTRIAFRTMLGDAKLTEQLLQKLTQLSNATSFTSEKIIDSAKKLLGFGVAAGEVTGELSMLGDVSAGVGKDLEELSAIYGKAFVKGRADMEILNQLSEAGIPIIKALAAHFGVTGAEVIKMASAGKVGFGDLQTAMRDMTSEGGQFFEMMKAQSQTLNGQISTLEGTVDDLMRRFGELTLPELKIVVSGLQEAVSALNDLAQARKLLEQNGGDVQTEDLGDVKATDRLKAASVRIGTVLTSVAPMPDAMNKRMRRGIRNVQDELEANATRSLEIAAPDQAEIQQAKKDHQQGIQQQKDDAENKRLAEKARTQAFEDELNFQIASDLGDALLESNQETAKVANEGIASDKQSQLDTLGKERDALRLGNSALREAANKVAKNLDVSHAGGEIVTDSLTRIGGARGMVIAPEVQIAQESYRVQQKIQNAIDKTNEHLGVINATMLQVRDKVDPEFRF